MARGKRSTRGESMDGSTSTPAGGERTTPRRTQQQQHQYRKVLYVNGVEEQSNLTTHSTFNWAKLLEELCQQSGEQQQQQDEDERVLPVALFGNPPLGHFLKVMHNGLKLEVRHHDYDTLFPDKEVFWIANISKIVGYRLLMRFEGMDQEGDEKHDFWVNVGSEEVKHVGYCSTHEGSELLPPNAIRRRQADWSKYVICKLHAAKTLTQTWEKERQLSLIEGRFKVGTRLELLDRQFSNHIRPARVLQQLGRRICVRVSKQDVDEADLGEDRAQTETGIWCDEGWELIFPVGWAKKNGWKLVASQHYLDHCDQIQQALEKNFPPPYAPFDASPEIFNDWKENNGGEANSTVHWKEGVKFEALDPINLSFLELKVATCIGLLQDGYLKVGFDGPDMEDEAIPIHCTSPYLFPINYAKEHGIKLVGPSANMEDFKWKEYLRQCQSTAAHPVLFDPVPSQERMAQFKVGAKLEATDQCESNLVCPATIQAVRGRLLQVHFDGWCDEYDQLFDYRSRDLFPLGWSEMYGYKLEIPKGSGPLAKRKKKSTT